jgi:hypothetical protein
VTLRQNGAVPRPESAEERACIATEAAMRNRAVNGVHQSPEETERTVRALVRAPMAAWLAERLARPDPGPIPGPPDVVI